MLMGGGSDSHQGFFRIFAGVIKDSKERCHLYLRGIGDEYNIRCNVSLQVRRCRVNQMEGDFIALANDIAPSTSHGVIPSGVVLQQGDCTAPKASRSMLSMVDMAGDDWGR